MKALKEFALLFCLGLVALACVAWYTGAHDVKASTTGPGLVTPVAHVDQGDSVVGRPTVTEHFINQVLCRYQSPACGAGDAMYTLGVQYGIDPVYALAFFWHESGLGTRGEARTTHSIGNLRCIPDARCIDQDRGGYAAFDTWQDGARAWYKLIRGLYVDQWQCDTVAAIIPHYAPNADHNNEQAYIDAVNSAVTLWRSGAVALP